MRKNLLIFFLALAFVTPFSTMASVISVIGTLQEVRTGDTFMVDVVLDAEGREVNAIQGELMFPPNLFSVKAFYERDSIMGVWVERPRVVEAGKLFWSGIMPGGFSGILGPYQVDATPGRLFTIQFQTLQEGEGVLALQSGTVLLHDGVGTKDAVTNGSMTVMVSDEAPYHAEVRISDRNPPEAFIPEIVRDADTEDGKWMLVWNAHDKETGISYFTVFESPRVRKAISEDEWESATSPYVLRDQARRSYVYLRAVDGAGNERVVGILPERGSYGWRDALIGFAILIVLACTPLLWQRKYRSRAD